MASLFLPTLNLNRAVLGRTLARQTPSRPREAAAYSSLQPTAAVVVPPARHITRALFQLPPAEQALVLIGFILCTIVVSVFSFVAISLPTVFAARRVLTSLDKLNKMARAELPGTMASIKLSCIEINDLTHQLSGLRTSLHEMSRKGKHEGQTSDAGKSKSSPIIS